MKVFMSSYEDPKLRKKYGFSNYSKMSLKSHKFTLECPIENVIKAEIEGLDINFYYLKKKKKVYFDFELRNRHSKP